MSEFDPAAWLERAEAYGYTATLCPDFAGKLGISISMPEVPRPSDPHPLYELNAAPGHYAALHVHLLSLDRVFRPTYHPLRKAIIRQMKRRGLLHRAPNGITGIREKDVLEAAGEMGMIIMGMEPPSLRDRGRTEP